MRILQLRPFKSDNWKSIERYGRLICSLNTHQQNQAIEVYTPPEVLKIFGSAIARRIFYPLRCMGFGKFEIIHILDAAYSNLIPFLPATRTVVTCHDVEVWRTTNSWNKIYRKYLLRCLSKAKVVVTPSTVVANQLRELFKTHGLHEPTIKVIPNGVDPIFAPKAVSNHTSNSKISLLYVAQTAWPRKNFDFLTDVLKNLSDRNVNFKLVHLGSSVNADQLERLKEMNLLNRWQTISNVSDIEVVKLYQNADLVLIPSTYEGFGYPLIEASACKTPFFASEIPTFRELLPESKLLLPFDVNVWAHNISNFATDLAFQEICRRESNEIQSKYNLTSHLNEYQRLYGTISETANSI